MASPLGLAQMTDMCATKTIFKCKPKVQKLPENSVSMQYADVYKDRGYKDRGASIYTNIVAKS
jgi:alpha-amylase/alpha-mannosidase (GH57 family)